MVTSPTTQAIQSDHPLSPTGSNHVGMPPTSNTSTIQDDPLSPRLGDGDDQDSEEQDSYNRINSHPIRDISLSSTYSESDNLYVDLDNNKQSSNSLASSNGIGNGKGKGWIAGTASTERLTTSSSESNGEISRGYKPKQRQMSANSSADGSAYSGPQSNAGSDEEEKNVQAVSSSRER